MLQEKCENKVAMLEVANKKLENELEKQRDTLRIKILELEEARELNGIYSAKLTRMQRKFKKLKDEDEESYMEMTF